MDMEQQQQQEKGGQKVVGFVWKAAADAYEHAKEMVVMSNFRENNDEKAVEEAKESAKGKAEEKREAVIHGKVDAATHKLPKYHSFPLWALIHDI